MVHRRVWVCSLERLLETGVRVSAEIQLESPLESLLPTESEMESPLEIQLESPLEIVEIPIERFGESSLDSLTSPDSDVPYVARCWPSSVIASTDCGMVAYNTNIDL